MKKIFTLIFFLFTGLFSFSSAFAQRTGCPTEGLVPCGTETCPCTLCDFFVMFERIIDFLLVPCSFNSYFPLVPAIGALMLAIGGFMYVFAYGGLEEITDKGGPKMLGQAKKLFSSVIIGFLIIYSAWLAVSLFFQAIGTSRWTGLKEGWWEIECDVDVVYEGEWHCKQKGCFWVEDEWINDRCVCPETANSCNDCFNNRECCESLRDRGLFCKMKSIAPFKEMCVPR